MEIIICQTCGSILACTDTRCSNCNAALSEDSVFKVSPIKESPGKKNTLSFFEDELNSRRSKSSEATESEDSIEPDLYVLSRPTIASAFCSALRTQADPASDLTSEESSDGDVEVRTRNERSGRRSQLDDTRRSVARKQNLQKRNSRKSARAKSAVSSAAVSSSAVATSGPRTRFTNKHMSGVLGAAGTAVVVFALITVLQNYEVSVQFFNPFAPLISWFMVLPVAMKYMVGAASLLLVAVFAFLLSYAFFSPNGKLNVWEKQKYVPTQFKSQHADEVRALSKPVQPGGMPLGLRNEWKIWNPFAPKALALTSEIRDSNPHVLIAGSGDTGKTCLMTNMILHDIDAKKRAVVVVDSDGKLSDLITRWISVQSNAEEYAARITLLEPNHKGNELGYNPLQMPEDGDLQSAANAIVFGFKAIYTETPGAQNQWSQQTANILRNAAMLLIANGRTLIDLPALLNDNDFRDVLLESVEKRKNDKTEYVTLLESWANYKRLARSDQWIPWIEPILNRVTPMLGDSRLRSILTKPISDLNLKKIIQERRVLIVKVPKGKLDQNGCLLGSLIVTGIKQAAISMSNDSNNENSPVALYLDELENFIEKETFESLTQDTEDLKIGIVGSLKSLQLLPEDFRNQLIIGFKTLCCFTLTKKDADLIGPQIFRVDGRKVKIRTLQNWFNPVNTAPQYEQVTDEEKLNSDRLVGQNKRNFFCYRVGTAAGVFSLKTPNVEEISKAQANLDIIATMRQNC